jgi:hypothetical protein
VDTVVSSAEINVWLQKLPDKIKMAPTDQKIAYYAIILGVVLIIFGILQKFIF